MKFKNSIFKGLKFTSLSILLILFISGNGFAAQKVKFGVPAWPGVTVKTEVMCQILEDLGYETEQFIISPSIIFKSMQTGDVNAFLGGWTPVENPMIDPLVKAGKIEKVQANIENAVSGLCVPGYVWDAGVHSVKDMTKYCDKFKKDIYCIEAGSGISDYIEEAINKNADNLGDWELVNSSTSGMLSQAKSFMKKEKWVVFFGWAPHWMNIKFDIKYLESSPATENITSKKSIVYTIVPSNFSRKNPEVYRLFKQFKVPSKVQSAWIYKYGFENIAPEKVALMWIKENRDLVSKWLENVKASDGSSAIDKIYKN